MRLETMYYDECSTPNTTTAAQRPGVGITSLVQASMTYEVEPLGIIMALTVTPKYDDQVHNFFRSVICDVLARTERFVDEDPSVVEDLILKAASVHAGLHRYHVRPKGVIISELADSPTTQLITALGPAAAAFLGGRALGGPQ